MLPNATRAHSAKAVEQIKMAKPRTRTQGVSTASECQSDLGKTLTIAHATAATTKPVDRFDLSALVSARGPREAVYIAPTAQASTITPSRRQRPRPRAREPASSSRDST
jgi:hypothetical protein